MDCKIIDLDSLDGFEETVYRYTGAPVIAMERTSCTPGDTLIIDVWGTAPEMTVGGKKICLQRIDTTLVAR